MHLNETSKFDKFKLIKYGSPSLSSFLHKLDLEAAKNPLAIFKWGAKKKSASLQSFEPLVPNIFFCWFSWC